MHYKKMKCIGKVRKGIEYVKETTEFVTFITKEETKTKHQFLANLTKYMSSKNNNTSTEIAQKVDIALTFFPKVSFTKEQAYGALKQIHNFAENRFIIPKSQLNDNINLVGLAEFLIGIKLLRYDEFQSYNVLSTRDQNLRFSLQVRQKNPDGYLLFDKLGQKTKAVDIKFGNIKSDHWSHVHYITFNKELGFNLNLNSFNLEEFSQYNLNYINTLKKVSRNIKYDDDTRIRIESKLNALEYNYNVLMKNPTNIPEIMDIQNQLLLSLHKEFRNPFNPNLIIIEDDKNVPSLNIETDEALITRLEKKFDPANYFKNYNNRNSYINVLLNEMNIIAQKEIRALQNPRRWGAKITEILDKDDSQSI